MKNVCLLYTLDFKNKTKLLDFIIKRTKTFLWKNLFLNFLAETFSSKRKIQKVYLERKIFIILCSKVKFSS